jgi:hypothetical protein
MAALEDGEGADAGDLEIPEGDLRSRLRGGVAGGGAGDAGYETRGAPLLQLVARPPPAVFSIASLPPPLSSRGTKLSIVLCFLSLCPSGMPSTGGVKIV